MTAVMRAPGVLAVSALVALACTDSTGPDLQGPSFARALINGSPWSIDDQGSFLWWVTADSALSVQTGPGTASPTGYRAIGFQVGHYRGPGTYPLAETVYPGPVSSGYYDVFAVLAGPSLVPAYSFQTGGVYKGTVRIIAVDTTLRAIVGTFEFTAGAPNGNAVVHITQGSFRIRLPT